MRGNVDVMVDYTLRRYGPKSYDVMRPAVDLLVQAVYNNPFGSGVIPGQWNTPDDPYYTFRYLGFGNPGGWPWHEDHAGPPCGGSYSQIWKYIPPSSKFSLK